jgi:hypothetical protein
MRKSGTLRGFSGAIKFTQIAKTYLPIPLQIIRIDHVHDFGLNQSKIIVIYSGSQEKTNLSRVMAVPGDGHDACGKPVANGRA